MQQPCFLYISGSEGDGLQILTKCKLKRMGIYCNKTIPPRKHVWRMGLFPVDIPLSPAIFMTSHFYGEEKCKKKWIEVLHKRKPIQVIE